MPDYSTMGNAEICQVATIAAIQALCEIEQRRPRRETHAQLGAILDAWGGDLNPALDDVLPILRDDLAILLDLPIPLVAEEEIAQRAANALDALAARRDQATAEARWAAALGLVQAERAHLLGGRETVAALAAQWGGVVTWQG